MDKVSQNRLFPKIVARVLRQADDSKPTRPLKKSKPAVRLLGRMAGADANVRTAALSRSVSKWVTDKVMFDSGRIEALELAIKVLVGMSANRELIEKRIDVEIYKEVLLQDGSIIPAFRDGFCYECHRLIERT